MFDRESERRIKTKKELEQEASDQLQEDLDIATNSKNSSKNRPIIEDGFYQSKTSPEEVKRIFEETAALIKEKELEIARKLNK